MADCAVQPAAKIRPAVPMAPPHGEERRAQTNGHASPVRLAANPSSPADLEGCLKTDDRMRLAKERREEREKSLAAREQAMLERERRAQLQYARQVEERWRRLEEQRQREELRRAAVEEKRRQRMEEEKERLEALMRRSLERSLQLEHRPKRWTWGGATGGREGDCEYAPPLPVGLPAALAPPPDLGAPPPDLGAPPPPGASEPSNATDSLSASTMNLPKHSEPPISKRLSSSSATITHSAERVSHVCSRVAAPSPHRSPYRGSPGRAERRKTSAGSPESSEESAKVTLSPDTPKLEKARKEKRMSSPLPGSPLRRAESPAVPAKRPSSPATPKLPQKTRAQSPSTARPYPPSPMKPRAPGGGPDIARKRGDPERGQPEPLRAEAQEKKLPKSASSELSNREGGERSAEPSPVTPTGKPIAGTTDAEEASRLLAERRRQARLQRELEERQQREQEEAERVRAEEERRKVAEERARQEEEARRAEEERLREEEEQRLREEAERQQRERQARELQARLDREREEAEARAQQEAERLRQERELQQLQMEQERLQRKKRIEEIMKRTRKSDTFESKKEEVKLETRTAVSFLRPVQSALLESRVIGRGIAPPPPAASEVPGAPLISLEPLEVKSGSADESADEVQPMDVSPVSKEELISIPEFSPLNERHPNEMSNAKALEDLLDLTGHVAYPPLTSPSAALGDCNKNLIEGFCSSSPDTQLIESLAQAVDKANIQ
ncbi:MAP7 domain-containing protein 2-like isoform X2 [Lepisosteus oculatus]|uniref:MAP7 domain-containing protein 2-like isoform X2 n=1 Tax=Lepisosteus oculatus TaxID=7918 RepID=UPI003720BAA4